MPRKSTKIHRICQQCGAAFLAARCFVRQGLALFCSYACSGDARRLRPLAERLREIADHAPTDECVLWTGRMSDKGYGLMRGDRQRAVRVHRAIWEYHHGSIPSGLQVCHRCDVPACYNIAHLFLGTPKQNTADMLRKGRECRGADQHNAVLNDDTVRLIRTLYVPGKYGRRRLALRFGVAEGTIQAIVTGRTWRHVR